MTMTRRDIIIISVLANIAVLAILFMLAFRTQDENEKEQAPWASKIEVSHHDEELSRNEPLDEVDLFIEEVAPIHQISLQSEDEQPQLEQEPLVKTETDSSSDHHLVEITVKSGDALEKIARSNGTTVEEIMKLNNLKNDRLRIGQVLKVPVRSAKNGVKKVEPPKVIAQENFEYYTIKSGDNPWKIAKQFHLKVDDLLLMNNLDEETARKLKAGDQIRIK